MLKKIRIVISASKKMTYKVSVTGIDGSGKSTSIAKVVDNISKEYLTAKIGRPTYVNGPNMNQKQYLFTNLNNTIDKAHSLADNIESKLLVASVSSLSRFAITHIENGVFSKFNPEVTIYSRDKIVDPAVYSTFYFPFTKKWSAEIRINIAKNIQFNTKPSDTIIYLDIDPKIAVERIEKRIEEEKTKSSDRNKWKHMHENVENLSSLRHFYEEALSHMEKKFNTEVITINVDNNTLNEVSSKIEDIIRKDLIKVKHKHSELS
jgi:thymidylate kinase